MPLKTNVLTGFIPESELYLPSSRISIKELPSTGIISSFNDNCSVPKARASAWRMIITNEEKKELPVFEVKTVKGSRFISGGDQYVYMFRYGEEEEELRIVLFGGNGYRNVCMENAKKDLQKCRNSRVYLYMDTDKEIFCGKPFAINGNTIPGMDAFWMKINDTEYRMGRVKDLQEGDYLCVDGKPEEVEYVMEDRMETALYSLYVPVFRNYIVNGILAVG